MPPPNQLATVNWGSGGLADAQVHEIAGGTTPTQIGSDVTGTSRVALSNVSNTNLSGQNKFFKGEAYALCHIQAGGWAVYKENEGGAGNWGQVGSALVQALDSDRSITGLHQVKDGNDIALVFAYAEGNNVRIVKSNTGQSASWTETVVPVGGGFVFTHSSFAWRNRIYVYCHSTQRLLEIDPQAGSVGIFTVPATTFSMAMAVMDDRMWLGMIISAPYSARLYEFNGSAIVFNSVMKNAAGGLSAGSEDRGNPTMFEDPLDPGKLVAFMNANLNSPPGQGTYTFKGTPTAGVFAWVEDTSTVPPAVAPGARGNNEAFREDRWTHYVDNDTDPANPVVYLTLIQAPAPGTGHSVLRYEGFGNEVGQGATSGETGPGAGVTTDFGPPFSPFGGGEDISQGPATIGEIEDEEAVPGGYRLSYRTPGTIAGLTGRVYFDVGDGYPRTLATLVGGLQTFGPITGDNRATLRTIDVDLALSGITGPNPSSWMIDFS